MDKIELLGAACFSHGPYTFYKAVRIGNGRVLRLGNFFLTKLWTDADLVSIGELQLLWLDSRGSNQPLASLRLYFLPENTPDGRRNTHGEDEVLTISEKVVVRVHDLVTWLSPSVEWSWGREILLPASAESSETSAQNHDVNYPQLLTDPGIDFTDVDKQQKEFETNACTQSEREDDNSCTSQTRVVVLSYPRYCRYRALLRRLEGVEPSWLCSSVAAALGGFKALPGTKVLFCRDTFDYPDLETHELLCNHLAPKLKGRPRRKRKKRSTSPGESSNESEASVASTSRGAVSNLSLVPALRPPTGVRRSERNTSGEEKRFLTDVHSFMRSRGTPVGKMPLLGYRQIDLFLFYTKVQKLGGYDSVSGGRLWKLIYDDIGGNVGSTSAATITRRHYERLLLPYERHQRGEETKVRPSHGRRIKSGSPSGETNESKPEIGRISTSETLPQSSEAPTIVSPVPPLQSILSPSPFPSGERPKIEGSGSGGGGKTSSLRSVRVKPERLKSLNTIIANSVAPVANQNSQQPSPSPPPSSNASNTSASETPSVATSSTTPTVSGASVSGASDNKVAVGSASSVSVTGQSVLERQLNSPLVSQQVTPSSTPQILPISGPTANSTAVITLTPPPERDIKEIKLEPKPSNLLLAHQGKENIPIYDEKIPIYDEKIPIYGEKSHNLASPRSPEVIDLETENDPCRDRIVIPSFKKRKLEILREGGLEVTAIDLDARPSVIQASAATAAALSSIPTSIDDDKSPRSFSSPVTPNSPPKLISVTVTPDIGHMLPSNREQAPINGNSNEQPQNQTRLASVKSSLNHQNNHQQLTHQTNNNNNSSSSNNNNNNNNNSNSVTNISRVINVGSPSNASLLQLYASSTNPVQPTPSPSPPFNHRFVPQSPTNERQPPPPKVTQSRSIFAHSEKMVYGNPKDILIPRKYHHHNHHNHHHHRAASQNRETSRVTVNANNPTSPTDILDLTQRQRNDRSYAGRPNLEIVRVPVVQRPRPLNLEMRNLMISGKQQQQQQHQLSSPSQEANSRNATLPAYAAMLDGRKMTSNNLEITLVSAKHRGHQATTPQIQHRPSPSPPISRHQSHGSNGCGNPTASVNDGCAPTRRHQNGKYIARSEPASTYATRKPGNQPIIPNVPNFHQLNNTAYATSRNTAIQQQQQQQQQQKQQQQQQQQQMFAEKRKTSNESMSVNRRISDSEKTSIIGQQQMHKVNSTPSRQNDTSRRHSVPASLQAGYAGPLPGQNSPGFLAQLPNTPTKFLPMLDPLYYSAFYNGLFPSPIPPASQQTYMSPEFSAYYKELLASSQQPRLATTGQHQPAVPTSK